MSTMRAPDRKRRARKAAADTLADMEMVKRPVRVINLQGFTKAVERYCAELQAGAARAEAVGGTI